ncbi:hypothetical protein D3C75_1371210 [compost metagenome]
MLAIERQSLISRRRFYSGDRRAFAAQRHQSSCAAPANKQTKPGYAGQLQHITP